MPTIKNLKTKLLTRTELYKRFVAFVVTGLALFVLTCLVWPFSVTTFRSVASINLAGASDSSSVEELESALTSILKEETTDDRLESFIAQIEAAGKPQTKQIEFRDHESIRGALMMGINRTNQGITVLLGYDGHGASDERELVNLLTARVAQRLDHGADLNHSAPFAAKYSLDEQNSIQELRAAQNQSIDEATWIVDQIESDLGYVKQSLSQIGNSPRNYQAEPAGENASPFQYASSSRVVSETIDPLELNTTVSSIDVQPLRSILTDIRNRADAQASILSKHDLADSHHSVTSLKSSQTLPVNGTPGFASVILLGLLSVVVATTVALQLDPFVERGFDNPNSLETKLGIPIVAEIRREEGASINEASPNVPWANRAAHYAGLCLFGIFVVVAGFILINSEVRETFFENPLHGCAKIIRIFAGY